MPELRYVILSKTFEQKGNSVEALRDISLDIEEGDIYGIIGMSGAGKKYPGAVSEIIWRGRRAVRLSSAEEIWER